MIDPKLRQDTLDFLAEYGLANLPDQQLPSPIREMLVSNGAVMAARVPRGDGFELVLINDIEYQAVRAAGIPPQHYAELKLKRETERNELR